MIEPTSRHVKAARDVIMQHEYGSANPNWMITPAPWIEPLAEKVARAVLNVEPETEPKPIAVDDDGYYLLHVRGPASRVDPITKHVVHPRPELRRPSRWGRIWQAIGDAICELVRALG